MASTSAPKAAPSYPCPDCIGTLIPGETVTLPRVRGSGKIAYNPSWNWPSGSFQPGVQYPPDEYRKCLRCDGTGLVADRRRGPRDRRQPTTLPALRAADRPELGTKNYSIDAVGREGGKASTEVKK